MLVLRAEVHKLASNRLAIVSVFAPLVLVPLLTLLTTHASLPTSSTHYVLLRALQVAQVCPILAGAITTGQEYADSTLRNSLLAVPKRTHLLWAKILVITVSAVLSYLMTIVVTITAFKPRLAFITVLAAGGSWIGQALLAAFLATTFRSIIVPLATMLPLTLGLSMIIYTITPIAKFLPDLSTMTIFTPPNPQLLSPMHGGVVLTLWVVTTGITAFIVLTRADVR